MKFKINKEEFQRIISESFSITGVLRKLGMSPNGGNYSTIYNKLKEWDISIAHFTGQAWNAGKIHDKTPIEDILSGVATTSNTNLRKRIFSECIFKFKCDICQNTEWMGKPIPLELDHIDGNNSNNIKENLRLICPNCHAQTPTWKGRNIKINKPKKVYIKDPQKCLDCAKEVYKKSTRCKPCFLKHTYKKCEDCTKNISKNASRCKSCAMKKALPTKIPWLPMEELLERLKTSNYSALARELGVSDNAIRKHIKNHNTLSVNALST